MMTNVEIVLLLCLSAYASCNTSASSENAAGCNNPDLSADSSLVDPEEKSDAEIIEDVFMDCRKFVSIPINNYIVDSITTYDFCNYMGDTVKDFDIVHKNLKVHPKSLEKINYIDLQIFGEYFTNYCGKILNLSVKECAKQRKNATTVKTNKALAFWKELRRKLT